MNGPLFPHERTAEYLGSRLGLTVIQGTLAHILNETHRLLAKPVNSLVKYQEIGWYIMVEI